MEDRGSTGSLRTFFVFVDFPVHVEYRAGNLPPLPRGTEMRVVADVRDPRPSGGVRKLDALYVVQEQRLVYQTARPSLKGLTQYLELKVRADRT